MHVKSINSYIVFYLVGTFSIVIVLHFMIIIIFFFILQQFLSGLVPLYFTVQSCFQFNICYVIYISSYVVLFPWIFPRIWLSNQINQIKFLVGFTDRYPFFSSTFLFFISNVI